MSLKTKDFEWFLIGGGILLIVFGLICCLWPGMALDVAIIVAGVGFLLSGVSGIAEYIHSRKLAGYSGWMLFEAIVDILLGMAIILCPIAGVGVAGLIIGICALLAGVIQIASSIKMHSTGIPAWFLITLYGILMLIFGILLIASPVMGLIGITFVIGIFAIVRGIMMLCSGFAL